MKKKIEVYIYLYVDEKDFFLLIYIKWYVDPDQKRAIMPEILVMEKDILMVEDFPIPKVLDPNSELEEGWLDTLPGVGVQPKKLVALDCEMVCGICVCMISRINFFFLVCSVKL